MGLAVVFSCSKFDDTALWNAINKNSAEIAALREKCSQMNSDISNLQTLVKALQNNDYITDCSALSDGSGYTIIFKSGKSIVIKNGTNGQNGKDGEDGQTPVISVKLDSDGIYYWTLNGTWLLDDKGNKIQAQGVNGSDGQNGQDGVTPKFKIDNGYWYISYDNEKTWAQLGKASGENGKDGKDGNAFFKSVEVFDKYVVFTLNDETSTQITLPLYSNGKVTALPVQRLTGTSCFFYGNTDIEAGGNDDIQYGFLYSTENDLFSKGTKVLTRAIEEDGTFICLPKSDLSINTTYYLRALVVKNGVYTYSDMISFKTPNKAIPADAIDMGLSVYWFKHNMDGRYSWGEKSAKTTFTWATYAWSGNSETTLTKYNTLSSYGTVDNKIELDIVDDAAYSTYGGNCRIPTVTDWQELIDNCTWTWTTVGGVNGYLIQSKVKNFESRSFFLPTNTPTFNGSTLRANQGGYYWTSNLIENAPDNAKCLYFTEGAIKLDQTSNFTKRAAGSYIRAVCDL